MIISKWVGVVLKRTNGFNSHFDQYVLWSSSGESWTLIHKFVREICMSDRLTSQGLGRPVQGEGYIELILAIHPNQLPPGACCNVLLGWNRVTPFTVCKDLGMGINNRSPAGRAECTTFPTFNEAIIWVNALLKGTSVMTGIGTHTLLLKTPELESVELDSSATTSQISHN